jgi:hypothetical protein
MVIQDFSATNQIHFRGDDIFYDLRDHDLHLLGGVPLTDVIREQVET